MTTVTLSRITPTGLPIRTRGRRGAWRTAAVGTVALLLATGSSFGAEQGPLTASITAVPATVTPAGTSIATVEPPEGIHPGAGSEAAGPLSTPPGVDPATVLRGSRIFHGQVANVQCAGCHGTNAMGTPLGPNLTSGKWVWGDGSLPSIVQTITNGVPHPKNYTSPMPAMGGAQLTPSQVSTVAAYVWALGHQDGVCLGVGSPKTPLTQCLLKPKP